MNLVIDTQAFDIWLDDHKSTLTRIEYDLMLALAARPYATTTRARLAADVWKNRVPEGSNTIDAAISRLRKQLPEGMLKLQRGRGWTLLPRDSGIELSWSTNGGEPIPMADSEYQQALAVTEKAFELALAYVRRARREATNG